MRDPDRIEKNLRAVEGGLFLGSERNESMTQNSNTATWTITQSKEKRERRFESATQSMNYARRRPNATWTVSEALSDALVGKIDGGHPKGEGTPLTLIANHPCLAPSSNRQGTRGKQQWAPFRGIFGTRMMAFVADTPSGSAVVHADSHADLTLVILGHVVLLPSD
ncbi:hypothetical protein L228DRAFT_179077 [Xylona heveae TC161]|uniref:Uncharacterized protein n=1 Tax=Xylona heveae (strain CBS 132557 / TC161) TaxID=1328760 RepID=A0A165FAP7_XYLHT|nr:hypothetical protein L228DRAFT_179077 [Xylona heveae TC161]KZF20769.1 hypothetical protein L228DRAFT_179077 [Xylona heveae TC161]